MISVLCTGCLFTIPSALLAGCNEKLRLPDTVEEHTEDPGAGEPENEGEGERYLFLDNQWIAKQSGVSRLFHAAVKEQGNPVIVKHDGEENIGPYMFYRGVKQPPCSAWFGSYDGSNYPLSFTTSVDGSNWNGARYGTNMITVGDGNIQCAVPVYDGSGQYGDYPYLSAQGLRSSPVVAEFHWRFLRSRDGIHWELFPGAPIWEGPSDVMHIQWDQRKERFIAYFKVWRYKGTTLDGKPFVAYGQLETKIEGNSVRITGNSYLPKQTIDVVLEYGGDTSDDGGGGTSDTKMQMARVVGYAESSDFLHWENEQIIIAPPDNAPLGDQSYGMNVTCYGNMYVAMYHHFNAITGLIQPMLAWSYDGIRFTLHEEHFFFAAGETGEWDVGMVFPSDVIDAGNGRMYVYYGSLGVDHKNYDMNQYRGAFGRAWLRRDGFASLQGGWIETIPLKVQRKRMRINMSGEIGMTLKTTSGETIGEIQLRGDLLNHMPDIDLSPFLNCDITVRLELSKGELFSITL